MLPTSRSPHRLPESAGSSSPFRVHHPSASTSRSSVGGDNAGLPPRPPRSLGRSREEETEHEVIFTNTALPEKAPKKETPRVTDDEPPLQPYEKQLVMLYSLLSSRSSQRKSPKKKTANDDEVIRLSCSIIQGLRQHVSELSVLLEAHEITSRSSPDNVALRHLEETNVKLRSSNLTLQSSVSTLTQSLRKSQVFASSLEGRVSTLEERNDSLERDNSSLRRERAQEVAGDKILREEVNAEAMETIRLREGVIRALKAELAVTRKRLLQDTDSDDVVIMSPPSSELRKKTLSSQRRDRGRGRRGKGPSKTLAKEEEEEVSEVSDDDSDKELRSLRLVNSQLETSVTKHKQNTSDALERCESLRSQLEERNVSITRKEEEGQIKLLEFRRESVILRGTIQKLMCEVKERDVRLRSLDRILQQTNTKQSLTILNAQLATVVGKEFQMKRRLADCDAQLETETLRASMFERDCLVMKGIVAELEARVRGMAKVEGGVRRELKDVEIQLGESGEKLIRVQRERDDALRRVEEKTEQQRLLKIEMREIRQEMKKFQKKKPLSSSSIHPGGSDRVSTAPIPKQLRREALRKVEKSAGIRELENQVKLISSKLDRKAKGSSLMSASLGSQLISVFQDRFLRVFGKLQREALVRQRLQWEIERIQANYESLQKALSSAVLRKQAIERKMRSSSKRLQQSHDAEKRSLVDEKRQLVCRIEEVLIDAKKLDSSNLRLSEKLYRALSENRNMAQRMEQSLLMSTRRDESRLKELEGFRTVTKERVLRYREELQEYWAKMIQELQKSKPGVGGDEDKDGGGGITKRLSDEVLALKIVHADLREDAVFNEKSLESLRDRTRLLERVNEELKAELKARSSSASTSASTASPSLSDVRHETLEGEVQRLHGMLRSERSRSDQYQKRFGVVIDDGSGGRKDLVQKIDYYSEKIEQQVRAPSDKLQRQNELLVARVATLKLELDTAQADLKERETEVELLTRQMTRVGGGKKKSTSERLAEALKQQAIAQRKLVRALNAEMRLRKQLEERSARIKELRHALEMLQAPSSPSISRKKEVIQLPSMALVEKETEIEFLKRKLAEERLKIARTASAEVSHQKREVSQSRNAEERSERLAHALAAKEAEHSALEQEVRKKLLVARKEIERLRSAASSGSQQVSKLKVAFGQQKKVLQRLRISYAQEATKTEEANRLVEELRQHKEELVAQLEVANRTAKFVDDRAKQSMEHRTSSLEQTMGTLAREQKNVQKLMKVITSLRARNDGLLSFKREVVVLKEEVEDLKRRLGSALRDRAMLKKKFSDARDYVKSLRDERDGLQRQKKETIASLEKELDGFKRVQQDAIEGHLREIQSLTADNQKYRESVLQLQATAENRIRQCDAELRSQLREEKNAFEAEKKVLESRIATLESDVVQKEHAVEQESRRMELAEQKIIQERDALRQEWDKLQSEFAVYRQKQQEVVEDYEQQLEAARSDLSTLETVRKRLSQLSSFHESVVKKKDESEKMVSTKNVSIARLQDRIRTMRKTLREEKKRHGEEKARMSHLIDQMKKNRHSEEEWRMISLALRNAKKALKTSVDENRKKAEIISSMKGDMSSEISRLETSIQEHQSAAKKFRGAAKENQRKTRLLRDYRVRLRGVEEELGAIREKSTTSATRVRELSQEQSRKDKYVKSLQVVIEKKNQFIEDMKKDLQRERGKGERRDSQIKLTQTKLERVQQSQRMKEHEAQSHVQGLQGTVVSIATEQVAKIASLEDRTLDAEREMARRKRVKMQDTRQQQRRKASRMKPRREEEVASGNSSVATTDILESTTSSVSSHASHISHADIGLSVDEMQDIMQSYRKSQVFDPEPVLPVTKNVLMMPTPALYRSKVRTSEAKNLLYLLKRNVASQDGLDETQNNLADLITIRMQLEKADAVYSRKEFFTDEFGDPKKSVSVVSSVHKKASRNSSGLHRENVALRQDVAKMKQREMVYENTIHALEKQLLQD